jgi:hypothetical protein
VFEITPKEQILKSIRKNLVQPLSNPYANINLDLQVTSPAMQFADENFVIEWTKAGFYFQTYNGPYDFLNKISGSISSFQLGTPALSEKHLCNLFDEHELQYLKPETMHSTLISSVAKLESGSQTLFFNSEIQPVIHFNKAVNLILYCSAQHIENIEENKYFSDISIKNNVKVQLQMDFFKSFEKVILLVEETPLA